VGRQRNGRPSVSSREDGSDDLITTHMLPRVSALVDAAAVLCDEYASSFARTCALRDAIAAVHLYRSAHYAHLAAELLAQEAEGVTP
jgi:hypothetical protein